MSVSPQALERSVLERKERDELAAIAEAMGVKANSRTSKANLIEGILREAGVETGEDKPKRAKTAKSEANGEETAEKTEEKTEDKAAKTEKPAVNGGAAAEETQDKQEKPDENAAASGESGDRAEESRGAQAEGGA